MHNCTHRKGRIDNFFFRSFITHSSNLIVDWSDIKSILWQQWRDEKTNLIFGEFNVHTQRVVHFKWNSFMLIALGTLHEG